jgi:hypothetical protein
MSKPGLHIRLARALTAPLAVAVLGLLGAVPAQAATPVWRLEQPQPPVGPKGQQSSTPIGLGNVGDIEFWAPNRGLLITSGNPETIKPGVWVYNGRGWKELAEVCGATDGRIAWAGPEEFWTISDGRPGEAVSENGKPPPLADNTLCHFNNGKVEGSYAAPAFQAGSYQAMDGAGCFGPEDCWFAGEPLPEPQTGAFQLHWNGSSLVAEPNPQGHAVESMSAYAGGLYEGVLIRPQFEPREPEQEDRVSEEESPFEPSDLHLINPAGVSPTFESLTAPPVPVYEEEGEAPWALEGPLLGSDSEALWAAVNPLPRRDFPQGSEDTSGQVTIVRDVAGSWTQVVGPYADPAGNPFTTVVPTKSESVAEASAKEAGNETVTTIAPEPGSEDAWVGLSSEIRARSGPLARAVVERISADGTLGEAQTMPTPQEESEGVGPKGAAQKIVCPEHNDCWLVTTQGWLFHLSSEAPEETRMLPEDYAPNLTNLISERPPDAGVPQVQPDTLPEGGSGVLGERPAPVTVPKLVREELTVHVPLLKDVHSRLVHRTTLELSFRLTVKARLRLLAERHKKVVASTPTRVLNAGRHSLSLRLNVHHWPTKLNLQTHPLAPLPVVPAGDAGESTVTTTSLEGFPARVEPLLGPEALF